MINMSVRGNPSGSWRGGRSNMPRGGRNRGSGRSNGRGPRLVCQLCGKIGYSVQRCYHRFDVHFEGPGPGDDNHC